MTSMTRFNSPSASRHAGLDPRKKLRVSFRSTGWRLILLAVTGLLAIESLASWHAPELNRTHEHVALSIGRSMNWPVPPGIEVSVSNGAAIRVADKGHSLRITAKKLGLSVIRVGQSVLTVSVLPEARYSAYERLLHAVQDRRGLVVDPQGHVMAIRGRLLRFGDWLHLARRAEGIGQRYEFLAEVEPDALEGARSHFQTLLHEAHLPDLDLQLHPTPVVILPLEPADLEARVQRVLGPYGIRIERHASALTLAPLVRVRILVAEFRKSMTAALGLRWPEALRGQLLPSLKFSGEGSDFALHAFEQNGFGKILASPTILCRSGKEAHFLAGGEFPIKVASFKTNDVIWKRYGVLLRVRPQADDSGRMSIAIETEVSMIDDSQKIDGLPGLLTNRIETHFDLNSGRTIALSGLIKKEWGHARQGLPAFSSIPVLGPLFGSQDYRDNRTELVIFVTPEITRPDQEGT